MSMARPAAVPPARATLRFAEKREAILDGAARLFNRRGIKAGTLAEVAAGVGLATNSLTYYYRKKEDLAGACLLRSIEVLDQLIADAAAAPDLPGRVAALVQGFVGCMADIAAQRRPELIFFGDMRALPQPQAAPVFAAYVDMFRALRRLLRQGPAPLGSEARRALNARSHGLLAQLLWSRAWLGRYEPADYPRAARALVDVLLHGLAAPGQPWAPDDRGVPAPPPAPGDAAEGGDAAERREAYLRTATRLVNDHGVGGASVERIAAELALTKGSFYHHHDTKHGLIDDCVERSFALIRGTQLAALAGPGNGWQRLLAATVPLVRLHDAAAAAPAAGAGRAGQGPLLRLSAWTELPDELRWRKRGALNRLAERYAAMVVDGMVDGSLRLVDPAVASHALCGLLNGLAEVGHWVPGLGPTPLATLYARPLLCGLAAPAGPAAGPDEHPPGDPP